MVIDFLNLNQKEQPVLVLRNLDGTAIQTLGYAFNIKGEFCYNEISTLTFDVPAYANGTFTPHYNDIIGTRIVDLVGWGQFILIDPEIKRNGISEIKSCKAYSLEYELTYKQMSLPEYGYYLKHDDKERSLLDIVQSYIPSWTISIDPEYLELANTYRYFSENRVNVYNFLKSTIQKKYNCIIDFDTYKREISARPAGTAVETKEVFLSTENLVKELSISEDTENIFTVLDVNGADGVSISRVNPIGGNKIYNLDYFMNESHFSKEMISQWEAWKVSFEKNRQPYYNLAIRRLLKTSQIVLEQENLRKLQQDELLAKKNEQAVWIEFIAKISDKESTKYADATKELKRLKSEIEEYEKEGGLLDLKQKDIQDLEDEKEALTAEMKAIVAETELEAFFDSEQMLVLNRYFKEDSIEDSSFVLSQVDTFDNQDISTTLTSLPFSISGANISMTTAVEDKEIYTVVGGKLVSSNIGANIVRLTIEYSSNGKILVTGFLNNGTINDASDASFDSGTVTIYGNSTAITHDAKQSEITSLIYEGGTSLSCEIESGDLYFTRDKSEYEEFAVCWDLYEYGAKCLDKLAYPSFSFKISAANFLTLDKFNQFAVELELGKKVYVEKAESNVLEPILTKVSIEFEDPSSLQLDFSDTYSASDSKFSLVDLLDKSISLGKTVDAGKYSYNSFVTTGASTEIQKIIDDALDVTKNNILSSTGQAISWDETGMHFRKWKDDRTAYHPHEIGIINNNIVFTDNNWETAKMAIGYIENFNGGDDLWGIVAPNLVGKMVIGENLMIQTEGTDNKPVTFKVDASGASLYNSKFDIKNGFTHIVLDPDVGIAIGKDPVVEEVIDEVTGKVTGRKLIEDNANFYVDTAGNVHMTGILDAASGNFSGLVAGGEGENYVAMNGNAIDASDPKSYYAFWAGNEDPVLAEFSVRKDGMIIATGGIFNGVIQASNFQQVKPDGSIVNMLTSDFKFTSDFLSLNGLEIINSTTGKRSFYVSDTGAIEINGKVTLGEGSSISWSQVEGLDDKITDIEGIAEDASDEASKAYTDLKNLLKGYKTEYITSTFIDGKKIIGPEIIGGIFCATGKGVDNEAAYYIYSGYDSETKMPTGKVGYLSYDSSGAGSSEEAKERVLLTTLDETALKLNSAGNMSLQSGDKIFMMSKTQFSEGIYLDSSCYGESTPDDNTEGRLFFVLAQGE